MDKSVIRKIDQAVFDEGSLCRPKAKNRGRKRKREASESSTDLDDALPDNALEVEKSLHASAIKNNLDDESVKKILKKVVTNDHVLALVKIREQEEAACSVPQENAPKLTRAKAKELMKASSKAAPWNLELTPIKHIPVKTRPEVTALIAQELHEDEDDEEYEPTNDDVPSDDDQTLESCSDVDSQPRTPATPQPPSPRVLHDGPFKVPQPTTPARRKLQIPEEEEPTIALRTRSRINLSSTTIEHIESAFVPPDDVPPPRDEEWDQFLSGVFDPSGFREEDDMDETDPEYNVAADPDAHEEDDLDSSILRISRKELNDLVTELFSIMPEAAAADELADNLAKDVLTDHPTQIPIKWEGKQEMLSDEEKEQRSPNQKRRDSATNISLGKSGVEESACQNRVEKSAPDCIAKAKKAQLSSINKHTQDVQPRPAVIPRRISTVDMTVEEHSVPVLPRSDRSPPPLLRGLKTQITTDRVVIRLDEASKIHLMEEQVQVLQQQLRQHVQLATSNFLQLFVNPLHWALAPAYKQYLEQLEKMVESNPGSVVNVCNLQPGLELVRTWEVTVSEDTPENRRMVDFIQKEGDRAHRRFKSNALYTGEFPDTFKDVVANCSSVFLYPYLLPAMPYRIENYRKFGYRRSEDELLAIGLDQFWQYLQDNPQLHKLKNPNPRTRVGFNATVALLCKYMMPWVPPKLIVNHILRARQEKDNPLHRFFESREVVPVKHKLLPYNPELTLYQQSEHEMPRIWVRYLAKNSRRFRDHLYRRRNSGMPPLDGVPVSMGCKVEVPKKSPLPIDFTKRISCHRTNLLQKAPHILTKDTFDLQIDKVASNVVSVGEQLVEAGNVNNIQIDNSFINKVSVTNNPIYVNARTILDNIDNYNTNNKKLKENSTTPPSIDDSTDKTVSATQYTNPLTNTSASFIAQNLYKVIETSTGKFLVPLTVQTTSTVDSIKGPIASIEEKSMPTNKVSDPKHQIDNSSKDSQNHCQCCLLLRKICKQKQTRITDFFVPKTEKACRCSDKKYPKVSKRLRMLVNNFKSRSWCIQQTLRHKLNSIEKQIRNKIEDHEMVEDESGYDLEDIAYVTSYQLKLMNRTNIARDNYLKRRVNNLFSKFEEYNGGVIRFTAELFKALGVDLVDVYKEFLGFLTAEQAEEMNVFKDYFTQSCVSDFMKKIEHEVIDCETKKQILSRINDIFNDTTSTSCEMCFRLLDASSRYPRLATIVFDMFPHRSGIRKRGDVSSVSSCANLRDASPERQIQINETSLATQDVQEANQAEAVEAKSLEAIEEVIAPESLVKVNSETVESDSSSPKNETLTVIDYGTDHSDSDDGDNNDMTTVESTNTTITREKLESKTLLASNPHLDGNDRTTITVTKMEEVYDENSTDSIDMPPLVMSEDEIKSEPTEWSRDDDKVVLQLLLRHLSPKERQGKTVMEILDEKNLFYIISNSLPEKPLSDIRERAMYLLEILVMTH